VREDTRKCWAVNKRQDNKLEKLLYLVGDLFELKWSLMFVTNLMLQYFCLCYVI
jgi:hypothetical protein